MLLLDQPKLHTPFTERNRLVKVVVELDAATYLHPLVVSFIAPVVQPQVSAAQSCTTASKTWLWSIQWSLKGNSQKLCSCCVGYKRQQKNPNSWHHCSSLKMWRQVALKSELNANAAGSQTLSFSCQNIVFMSNVVPLLCKHVEYALPLSSVKKDC